jgi:hypothetical protein
MSNSLLARSTIAFIEEFALQGRGVFDEVFSAVDPDELGFALTLFFSAANKRLAPLRFDNPESLAQCEQFSWQWQEMSPRRRVYKLFDLDAKPVCRSPSLHSGSTIIATISRDRFVPECWASIS